MDYSRWLGTFFGSGTRSNSSVNASVKLSAIENEVMAKTPKSTMQRAPKSLGLC